MVLFQLLSGKFAVQQLIKSFNNLYSKLFSNQRQEVVSGQFTFVRGQMLS